jgi:cell division transport system permease protein
LIADIKYRKRQLGSYPYFLVLFSLIFSLTIIGLWGSLLIMGDQVQKSIKERISVQVYLQKDISADSIQKIQTFVANRPYVLRKGSVAQVEFKSKEEAAKKFIEETGENFAAFLGENPLRDALVVHIDPSFSKSAQLAKIQSDLMEQRGIFEVVYTENMADIIHQNIQKLIWAAIAFTIAMCIVILVLIMNTIRLAMYSQRYLIRSMQLVGARNWFIQRPYLFRSLIIGIIGGVISSLLILVAMEYSKSYFPEINNLVFLESVFVLMGGLVIGGGILCFLSSFLAVNRFLGKRLEDLY